MERDLDRALFDTGDPSIDPEWLVEGEEEAGVRTGVVAVVLILRLEDPGGARFLISVGSDDDADDDEEEDEDATVTFCPLASGLG